LLFGFERAGFLLVFREGGFSENYLSLPLRVFRVDYTGTQHAYSCGEGLV
jgi:hypothetical protein